MKACQAHEISCSRKVMLAREGGVGKGKEKSVVGRPLGNWCIILNFKC